MMDGLTATSFVLELACNGANGRGQLPPTANQWGLAQPRREIICAHAPDWTLSTAANRFDLLSLGWGRQRRQRGGGDLTG